MLRSFVIAASLIGTCPFLKAVEPGEYWTREPQGELIVEHFSKAQLGINEFVTSIVEDARGRLFFGSDELLVFDGATWTRGPIPDALVIRSMSFDAIGRLWAGGINQLGYFEEAIDGTFHFTSLREKIPAEFRQFDDAWACKAFDGAVFFVCRNSVLKWDGTKFHGWAFPTARRLYPVSTTDRQYFTHEETGLYVLTVDGPKLVHRSEELPRKPAFWIQPDETGIVSVSSAGVFKTGMPHLQLAEPDLAKFYSDNLVTSAARLGDNSILVGTLGGIALTSDDGRKPLRFLTTDDGLPTNGIYTIFVSKAGGVWIGTTNSGIFRFEGKASASVFRARRGSLSLGINELAWHRDTLVAATDGGLYQLIISDRSNRGFHRVDALEEVQYRGLLPTDDGIVLTRMGDVRSFDGTVTKTLISKNGVEFTRSVTGGDGKLYILETYNVGAFDPRTLRYDIIAPLPELSSQLFVDHQLRIWVNSPDHGRISYYDRQTATWSVVDITAGGHKSESYLAGVNNRIYAGAGTNVLSVDCETMATTKVAQFAPGTIIRSIAPTADGHTVYALIERMREGSRNYAIARISSGTQISPQQLDIPQLNVIGVPTMIYTRGRADAEALWVTGSDGALKLYSALLAADGAPLPPMIQSYEILDGTPIRPTLQMPYGAHHLVLKLSTPEVERRQNLTFQTRFDTSSAGEWSAPSKRSTFDFSNLSEGSYTFSARVLNAAGLASQPVTYRFRVLPPWWRSHWAYTGYAALLAGAFFGLVRVREHRIRRRNELLERTVEERTAELKKANAAKDEFLASVSHEIRNPLNGVVGLAAAINPERLDPPTRKQFEYLRHCATHLSGLLEDILDFAKLEAGAITIVNAPFDLHEMVQSVTAITAAESAKAGIRVGVAISPVVPVWVVGDAARIRQIILNFVINALRYAGRGEVRVTVYSKQSRPEQCEVTFAVGDDGPGISPDELAQLFTRFRRGSAARKSRVGGSGLGLSVCKNLAEKMGGRLWAESEPGHGSEFFVAIPLPLATPAANPVATNAAPRWHALIVDDEEYNLLALASLLEPFGFQLTQAENGTNAIEAARHGKFDVVFLDFDLPDMTGPDISRALRQMTSLAPDMPIIATTAFVTADKHALCMAAGMNAVISKPITAEKIRAALAQSSAAWRSVAPLHPPNSAPADPLAALKLLASRKGISFQSEVNLYFSELDAETVAAADAIRRRDGSAASKATHKLTGRFAFIHARVEEQLSREIEAAAVNAAWNEADAAWAMLEAQLPELRARVSAPDSAARGASSR